jgi:hypothetical protein
MRAVNLIPSEDRSGVGVGLGRSQGAAYAVVGMLAVLAIFALLYGLARHQVSSRRAQLATVAAQTQRAQESAATLSPYTSFMSLRQQRVQAVGQLVDTRFDWAHTIHELGRVLPRDVSIATVEGTVGAGTTAGAAAASPATAGTTPAPTAGTAGTAGAAAGSSTPTGSSSGAAGASTVSSATPAGSVPTITLGGCATSQAEVALALQRLRLIDGVADVSLHSSTKATGVGASASSGQCGSGPQFIAQLTFAPLPTPSTSGKPSAELTSSTGGGQ